MSTQTPHRLQQLAARSLLRSKALAIAALEDLPAELFPPLFMAAFTESDQEALKALVHSWPFTHLPLGGLIQEPRFTVLKAAFDGLDILLAQEVRPRRWKLQVLDLRSTGQNFWSMWAGDSDQESSPTGAEAMESSRRNHPLAPLEVLTDLSFSDRGRDDYLKYVIQLARQREGSLHLCCPKLEIFLERIKDVEDVLEGVQLACIREVEVSCSWDLATLGTFAPYLGQMSNLQRLSLTDIHRLSQEAEQEEEEEMEQEEEDLVEERERIISQFISQFLRLGHLRELFLESPSFLKGRLDQLLRSLQTPLDTFSIKNCRLPESDLIHLFQCPNLTQLKALHLNGVSLEDFSLEPLRALLEEVSTTLQVLDLGDCEMVDSQVEAIGPVLSRCHQLRAFSISENLLSVAAIGKLLRHTAGLPSLSRELYPVPLECYGHEGDLQLGRIDQIQDQLRAVLRDLGQPRTIWLSIRPCSNCKHSMFYDVDFL